MFSKIYKAIGNQLHAYLFRELQTLFDNGEYEKVLSYCTDLLHKRPLDLSALRYQANALLGLKRYEEAIEVCESTICYIRSGEEQLSEKWEQIYAEIKCCSLHELMRFQELDNYSNQCCAQFRASPIFLSYFVQAKNKLGELSEVVQAVERLRSMQKDFIDAWQFHFLVDALRGPEINDDADKAFQLGKEKFPECH